MCQWPGETVARLIKEGSRGGKIERVKKKTRETKPETAGIVDPCDPEFMTNKIMKY